MDGMQWVRESWRDTLARTSDWFNSSEYREDIEMAQKQYANPFEVGMTVRITGPCFTGQVGELQVIDPENIDSCDFFGVYLDSVEKVVPFAADEIERVEAEQEKPHPDACLCDECWAFRFAVCGYDD